MSSYPRNKTARRAGTLCAAFLGLSALTGCMSFFGPVGECTEVGLFTAKVNDKCMDRKLAKDMINSPFPDVVKAGLRFRAADDPVFAEKLRTEAQLKLGELYEKKPTEAIPVECDVSDVKVVNGFKEFNLTGCKPVAPAMK